MSVFHRFRELRGQNLF